MLRSTLNNVRKSRKDEDGFTLIELLIVIVILGVLAAIVVFSVRGITDTGEEAACKANEKTARTAIEAYYANAGNGTYPAALSDVVGAGLLADDPSAASVKPEVRVAYTLVAGPPQTYTLANGTAC